MNKNYKNLFNYYYSLFKINYEYQIINWPEN